MEGYIVLLIITVGILGVVVCGFLSDIRDELRKNRGDK